MMIFISAIIEKSVTIDNSAQRVSQRAKRMAAVNISNPILQNIF